MTMNDKFPNMPEFMSRSENAPDGHNYKIFNIVWNGIFNEEFNTFWLFFSLGIGGTDK